MLGALLEMEYAATPDGNDPLFVAPAHHRNSGPFPATPAQIERAASAGLGMPEEKLAAEVDRIVVGASRGIDRRGGVSASS